MRTVMLSVAAVLLAGISTFGVLWGLLAGIFAATMAGSSGGWKWFSVGCVAGVLAVICGRSAGIGMRHLYGTDSHGNEYSVWLNLFTGQEVLPFRGWRAVRFGLGMLLLSIIGLLVGGFGSAGLVFGVSFAVMAAGGFLTAYARRTKKPRVVPAANKVQAIELANATAQPTKVIARRRRSGDKSELDRQYEQFPWGIPIPTYRQFRYALKLGIELQRGMTFMDISDAISEAKGTTPWGWD